MSSLYMIQIYQVYILILIFYLCMHVYAHVCMCMYVYMFVYTYVCVCMYVYICTLSTIYYIISYSISIMIKSSFKSQKNSQSFLLTSSPLHQHLQFTYSILNFFSHHAYLMSCKSSYRNVSIARIFTHFMLQLLFALFKFVLCVISNNSYFNKLCIIELFIF